MVSWIVLWSALTLPSVLLGNGSGRGVLALSLFHPSDRLCCQPLHHGRQCWSQNMSDLDGLLCVIQSQVTSLSTQAAYPEAGIAQGQPLALSGLALQHQPE